MALFSYLASHPELVALAAGAGVAVLDLIFALNEKAASNGILHYLYLQLKSLKGDKPQA